MCLSIVNFRTGLVIIPSDYTCVTDVMSNLAMNERTASHDTQWWPRKSICYSQEWNGMERKWGFSAQATMIVITG